MTDLKDYARQEEATLDAAWLGANGIEAVVVDESGYGGNLLAATMPGTIRLQVLDDQVEAARELLREKFSSSTPEPAKEAPAQSPARADLEQAVFRGMVLVWLALFLVCWLFPEPFAEQAPEHVETYLLSITPAKVLWENSFDLYGANCLASVFASLLLCFFIRLGRVLYLVSLIVGTTLSILSPQQIINPLGSVIYTVLSLLSGAILAQMYLGSVAVRFQRTLPTLSGQA